MPSFEHSGDHKAAPEPWAVVPAQGVRDRQAAVSCLQAADTTDDAVERTFLRRRAAGLILPRQQVARIGPERPVLPPADDRGLTRPEDRIKRS